jgi:hypothetical protein
MIYDIDGRPRRGLSVAPLMIAIVAIFGVWALAANSTSVQQSQIYLPTTLSSSR